MKKTIYIVLVSLFQSTLLCSDRCADFFLHQIEAGFERNPRHEVIVNVTRVCRQPDRSIENEDVPLTLKVFDVSKEEAQSLNAKTISRELSAAARIPIVCPFNEVQEPFKPHVFDIADTSNPL